MGDMQEVVRLKKQAEYYRLYGYEFVSVLSDEQLAEGYNGIGPDWFPNVLRRAIDALHPDFLVVAFIHDEMWSYGDGTEDWFDKSNDYFEMNGRIVADAKYAWYDPRRYIRRRQSRIFADLCRDFGRSAFQSAYDKSQSKEG